MNGNNVTYFDSFEVEHIPKFIDNKNIIKNIYRIQANDSGMCEYLCIGFTEFFVKLYQFISNFIYIKNLD